jgi:hypothetical protein
VQDLRHLPCGACMKPLWAIALLVAGAFVLVGMLMLAVVR